MLAKRLPSQSQPAAAVVAVFSLLSPHACVGFLMLQFGVDHLTITDLCFMLDYLRDVPKVQ